MNKETYKAYLRQKLNEDKSYLSEFFEEPTESVLHVPQLSNPDNHSIVTIHIPGGTDTPYPHINVHSRVVKDPTEDNPNGILTQYTIRTIRDKKSYESSGALGAIEPDGIVVHQGTKSEGAELLHFLPGSEGSDPAVLEKKAEIMERLIRAHNRAQHPEDLFQRGSRTVEEARERQWANRNKD